jgi:hypothetical protein
VRASLKATHLNCFKPPGIFALFEDTQGDLLYVDPNSNRPCVVAVSRIGLVKPEKARAVESMILGMAQRRQITAKVSLLRWTFQANGEALLRSFLCFAFL